MKSWSNRQLPLGRSRTGQSGRAICSRRTCSVQLADCKLVTPVLIHRALKFILTDSNAEITRGYLSTPHDRQLQVNGITGPEGACEKGLRVAALYRVPRPSRPRVCSQYRGPLTTKTPPSFSEGGLPHHRVCRTKTHGCWGLLGLVPQVTRVKREGENEIKQSRRQRERRGDDHKTPTRSKKKERGAECVFWLFQEQCQAFPY